MKMSANGKTLAGRVNRLSCHVFDRNILTREASLVRLWEARLPRQAFREPAARRGTPAYPPRPPVCASLLQNGKIIIRHLQDDASHSRGVMAANIVVPGAVGRPTLAVGE